MTVQAGHEVLPGQLRRSDPDQHLPGRRARSRVLIEPILASNRGITPSRSVSSVTANIPEHPVSDRSDGPIWTRRRGWRFCRSLPTR
jgi:hypothetical protein